jgi:hypothetical protein
MNHRSTSLPGSAVILTASYRSQDQVFLCDPVMWLNGGGQDDRAPR